MPDFLTESSVSQPPSSPNINSTQSIDSSNNIFAKKRLQRVLKFLGLIVFLLLVLIALGLFGYKRLVLNKNQLNNNLQVSKIDFPKTDINVKKESGKVIAIWGNEQSKTYELEAQNFIIPYPQAYLIGVLYDQNSINGSQGDLAVFYAKFDEKNEFGGRIWYNYIPAQQSSGKWSRWNVTEDKQNSFRVGNVDTEGKAFPMRPGYYYFAFFNDQDKIVGEKTIVVGNPNSKYQELRPFFGSAPIPKFMPKGVVK